MGKKKKTGLSRQTIPREQKLDPDSSDEDSGDGEAGGFKIGPDTVLKLDDDNHSTVSSGASGETYTYSPREVPFAVEKRVADIHDGQRIERVTKRMQRTETVSGWNRGRALKEVGVEIPKDNKLYAKEFTPIEDPWGSSDTPDAEKQPWTKPIPQPFRSRTNDGIRAPISAGSASFSGSAKIRGRQNANFTSKVSVIGYDQFKLHTEKAPAQVSTAPSNAKVNPPKTRGTPMLVSSSPAGATNDVPRALGDRTNSGSYAAAVSSNAITDDKHGTVDTTTPGTATPVSSVPTGATDVVKRALGDRTNSGTYAAAVSLDPTSNEKSATANGQQRAALVYSANTNTRTPSVDHPTYARVTNGAATLSELAKMCEKAHASPLTHHKENAVPLDAELVNSKIPSASSQNKSVAVAKLAETANKAPVASTELDKGKGKARVLSGAAPVFKPGPPSLSVNTSAADLNSHRHALNGGDFGINCAGTNPGTTSETVGPREKDSAGLARAPGFRLKPRENMQVIADYRLRVPEHLVDHTMKPAELQALITWPQKTSLTHAISQQRDESISGTSSAQGPATTTSRSEGSLPTAKLTFATATHSIESSVSKLTSNSSGTKINVPAHKKTILHTKPHTIPEPGTDTTPIIYTATTTTTPAGAKFIEVDNFEYDFLYPLFTVEVRAGEESHTVVWYHPQCVEHSVVGLDEYLQAVFEMAEISLFVDYKCDEMGKKVRADVFWPGLDNWVSREAREREGMGV